MFSAKRQFSVYYRHIWIIAIMAIPGIMGMCIQGSAKTSCLEELSAEEANETLTYVLGKYEEVEMKIVGQPVSIYGLRLTHGDNEEELNIHFKYVDNTQQDIIQHCVFVLYHRPNECELIETICNTFLPITPRPLLQRQQLRVCDGDEVQLVEKEEVEETTEETSTLTSSDAEQLDVETERQTAQERSDETK